MVASAKAFLMHQDVSLPDGPIAGIDEAGRGPWAGPVIAAAVIFGPAGAPKGLDDSKALSEAARERLFDALHQSGASIGIGAASVAEIDRLNILQATFLAMTRALADLRQIAALALVDGNRSPRLSCPAIPVIRGDGLIAEIAAASIIAKVTRDRLMTECHQALPHYGFDRHKGYGTPAHRRALLRHGPSLEHRQSFKPIAELLGAAPPR